MVWSESSVSCLKSTTLRNDSKMRNRNVMIKTETARQWRWKALNHATGKQLTICSLGSKPCCGPGGRPNRSLSSAGSPGCGYIDGYWGWIPLKWEKNKSVFASYDFLKNSPSIKFHPVGVWLGAHSLRVLQLIKLSKMGWKTLERLQLSVFIIKIGRWLNEFRDFS